LRQLHHLAHDPLLLLNRLPQLFSEHPDVARGPAALPCSSSPRGRLFLCLVRSIVFIVAGDVCRRGRHRRRQ
jgi:hypothetical protein